MYEQVTSYYGKLKPAHWKYPENQGDGSVEHPYIAGWPEYDEITSVRGERFSSGLFGSYVANGTIDRMLSHLKEFDKL